MIHQKKHNWIDTLFLVLVCVVMDFLMLGICAARPFHWTRIGYVITLITQAPWILIGAAGLSSSMVGMVEHGQVVYEIAFTILTGATALFLLPRTISLSFARSVLASFLIALFLLAALALQGGPGMCLSLTLWTFFQIIANIIILNLLLKYTS